MGQNSPDWTQIVTSVVGVLGFVSAAIAGYTAFIFRNRLQQKDDQIRQKDDRITFLKERVEYLDKDYERRLQEREQESADLIEHRISGYERQIQELEGKLEEMAALRKETYEALDYCLDQIDDNSLDSQTFMRFKRLVDLLQELRDVDNLQMIKDCKVAADWLKHNQDKWADEASRNIARRDDDLTTEQDIESFRDDIYGYLSWVKNCLEVAHTENNPLSRFVGQPVSNSYYPYADAIRYIERKGAWGHLNTSQIKCLKAYLHALNEKLSKEFKPLS